MKHAILIQAHKSFHQLLKLVSFFNSQCDIFIHIDKKSKFSKENLLELASQKNVKRVYKKHAVHWGGFSLLKNELFLIKKALKHSDADYFHLLSGQDYPIKPLEQILHFFEKNNGKEFIEYIHLPSPLWEKNTYERVQYFFLYDWLDRTPKSHAFIKKTIDWQKKHGIKRRIPDYFDHLYGGPAWFSITRKGANTLLNYTRKKPAFYRRLKYTFASDEVYVNTVLANLTPPEDLFSKNYRHIRWKFENGSYPANLGKEHFHMLAESDCFFARKMEMPRSNSLAELIDQYLLQSTPLSYTKTGIWITQSFQKYEYDSTLADAISSLCKWMQIETAIDMGCGAGFYVAALRRKGIAIAGYDGNPHTPELSSLLLPENDIPCDVADLTEDLDSDESFDIVLCLEVLPYIPKHYEKKVIENLTTLSGKHLILTWATPEQERNTERVNTHSEEEITELLSRSNFIKNAQATSFLRGRTTLDNLRKTITVFDKRSLNTIS